MALRMEGLLDMREDEADYDATSPKSPGVLRRMMGAKPKPKETVKWIRRRFILTDESLRYFRPSPNAERDRRDRAMAALNDTTIPQIEFGSDRLLTRDILSVSSTTGGVFEIFFRGGCWALRIEDAFLRSKWMRNIQAAAELATNKFLHPAPSPSPASPSSAEAGPQRTASGGSANLKRKDSGRKHRHRDPASASHGYGPGGEKLDKIPVGIPVVTGSGGHPGRDGNLKVKVPSGPSKNLKDASGPGYVFRYGEEAPSPKELAALAASGSRSDAWAEAGQRHSGSRISAPPRIEGANVDPSLQGAAHGDRRIHSVPAARDGESSSSSQAASGPALVLDKGEWEGLPDEFFCPITLEPMVDPVLAADGFTYEREAVEEWLLLGHRSSPRTGLALAHRTLTPNLALRAVIHDAFRARKATGQ